MQKRRLTTQALALLFLLGCASVPHEQMVLSRLYLGLSSTSGTITPAQIDEFIGQEVTPRFPAFTRYAARGQWKDKNGTIINEDTEVIEIIHPRIDLEEQKLRQVIRLYKMKFSQESVLLVEDTPHIEFNED